MSFFALLLTLTDSISMGQRNVAQRSVFVKLKAPLNRLPWEFFTCSSSRNRGPSWNSQKRPQSGVFSVIFATSESSWHMTNTFQSCSWIFVWAGCGTRWCRGGVEWGWGVGSGQMLSLILIRSGFISLCPCRLYLARWEIRWCLFSQALREENSWKSASDGSDCC